MSRGFSLLGLLVALALGSSVMIMALERYQSLGFNLSAMRQRLALQQQARLVLFELAQDLRLNGQAGCAGLNRAALSTGTEVNIEYAAGGWNIDEVVQDGLWPRLNGLRVTAPSMMVQPPEIMVLSSCHHTDLLVLGSSYTQSLQQGRVRTLSFAGGIQIGGENGHHLPSLEIGPLVRRRYYLERNTDGKQVLLRQQGRNQLRLLEQVHAFSVRDTGRGGMHIELRFGDESQAWGLSVAARRQHGSALLLVLGLILMGMQLLSVTQRQLLDERRLLQHQEHWWQALQYAEHTLRYAEGVVARGAVRGVSAPVAARQLSSTWLRTALSPCHDVACTQVMLPHQRPPFRSPQRGSGSIVRQTSPLFSPFSNFCAQEQLSGRINSRPCYIVELLDASYQGGHLYRITVRAWGWTTRSEVTLQSYFLQHRTQSRRLSWKELP